MTSQCHQPLPLIIHPWSCCIHCVVRHLPSCIPPCPIFLAYNVATLSQPELACSGARRTIGSPPHQDQSFISSPTPSCPSRNLTRPLLFKWRLGRDCPIARRATLQGRYSSNGVWEGTAPSPVQRPPSSTGRSSSSRPTCFDAWDTPSHPDLSDEIVFEDHPTSSNNHNDPPGCLSSSMMFTNAHGILTIM